MKYRFADCLLDTDQRLLKRGGEAVPIEPQVFDLLHLLVQFPDRVVTRDEIVEAVWRGRIVSESAISARIAAVRKAVRDDGKRQAIIRTVARRGLQMVAEVTQAMQAEDTARPTTQTRMPPVRYARHKDGKMIAYTVTGAGPPLVHVGFFSRSVELEWRIDFHRHKNLRLAGEFQFLSFDEIGAGLSDRDPTEMTMEAKAEEIGTVADAAGFSRFSIFTESAGAMPAMIFAATHPHRVQCMVMSGGYVDGRLRRGTHVETDFVRSLIAEGWDPSHQALGRTYMTLYAPEGPHEAAIAAAEMMQAAVSQEVLLAHRDMLNHATIAPYLDKIECPVLAIHARRDSVHPLSEAQKLVTGVRNAELHVLDSGNHIPVGMTPLYEEYLETILAFLRQSAALDRTTS